MNFMCGTLAFMNPLKESSMKTTATLLAALAILAACETTEGLGRDTEKLGQNIEDAAQKNDGNAQDD